MMRLLKDINYKNILEDLLIKEEHSMIIDQSMPSEEQWDTSKSEMRKIIKEKLNAKKGVYIYMSLNSEECLYVGKAKNLYERVFCHYHEAIFKEVDGRKGLLGDSKKGLYPAFFNEHNLGDAVKVYWIEIDGDNEIYFEWKRRAVEAALHAILNPTFLAFQKKFNINYRAQKKKNQL